MNGLESNENYSDWLKAYEFKKSQNNWDFFATEGKKKQ